MKYYHCLSLFVVSNLGEGSVSQRQATSHSNVCYMYVLISSFVVQNLPSLIPRLVNVLDQPGYDIEIQTKAMETYNVVLCICMDASGPYQAYAFDLLPQLLEAWCARFCHILAIPLSQVTSTPNCNLYSPCLCLAQ